ncbi:hypothetical protein QOT17_013343 [Balamuthia mandrillaris]
MSKPKKFVVALKRFDAAEADTMEEKDGRRGANEAKTRHLPLLCFEAGDKIYVLSSKQHYRKQKEEKRQRKQQQNEEKKEKEENDKEEIKVKESHSHQSRAEENDGWLYGEFQGEKGFFPRFYATPVEEERPEFMYPKPTPPLRSTARSSSSRSISPRQENQIDTTETNASPIDTDDEELLTRRPSGGEGEVRRTRGRRTQRRATRRRATTTMQQTQRTAKKQVSWSSSGNRSNNRSNSTSPRMCHHPHHARATSSSSSSNIRRPSPLASPRDTPTNDSNNNNKENKGEGKKEEEGDEEKRMVEEAVAEIRAWLLQTVALSDRLAIYLRKRGKSPSRRLHCHFARGIVPPLSPD